MRGLKMMEKERREIRLICTKTQQREKIHSFLKMGFGTCLPA